MFIRKILKFLAYSSLALTIAGAAALFGTFAYFEPKLPSTDILRDVQLQVPLRVYTADGVLIAEFGEKRRIPLAYHEIPEPMIQAVLAAEDDRFFEHPGVDYQGLLRAGWNLLRTGRKGQGGSTITMQVARNFFLSREKTFLRKFNEILLSLKIERELSKEEILELYLNKIYLGNRAYGVGAAAQVYYGRELPGLSLAETAMIAGLPKAPSRFNPIADPERAVQRRNYVLGRMHALGYISEAEHDNAAGQPVTAVYHGLAVETSASYVAEMVRSEMFERFGEAAYTDGLRVYTTVDSRLQTAANQALIAALLAYDRRHGYRGAEATVDPANPEAIAQSLLQKPVLGGLVPAVVTAVDEQTATVMLRSGEAMRVPWEGMKWARPYLSETARGPEPKTPADVVAPGDLVRIEPAKDADTGAQLAQIPAVEGAFVALRPADGAILSLTGGFDFGHSKFNRATQAKRQPGSNFKPFIYSAALEQGFTAASLINDAPVVFEDPGLEDVWRPQNYSRKFFGPTRLRTALTKSRNLVSIRLLREIGIEYAIDYISRFGFDPNELPRSLSLALGSGVVTPLELVTGFSVFANGGFKVEPYLVERIEDSQGAIVFQARPATVCHDCAQRDPKLPPGIPEISTIEPTPREDASAPTLPAAPRVVSAQNAYIMTSMMQDVVKLGTARRARELGREDIAGKTGTTNDQQDAWFSGFNSDLVATAWVGFDQPRPMGRAETGGRAALPAWLAFMDTALAGQPEHSMEKPDGLIAVRIDPRSGLLAPQDQTDAVFEIFREDQVPEQAAVTLPAAVGSTAGPGVPGTPEQLF